MKPYKVKYHDKDGEKEERGFQNGIVRISILKPSESYKQTHLKPFHDAFLEEQKKNKHSQKIQEKLREMAEKELEKEKGE